MVSEAQLRLSKHGKHYAYGDYQRAQKHTCLQPQSALQISLRCKVRPYLGIFRFQPRYAFPVCHYRTLFVVSLRTMRLARW